MEACWVVAWVTVRPLARRKAKTCSGSGGVGALGAGGSVVAWPGWCGPPGGGGGGKGVVACSRRAARECSSSRRRRNSSKWRSRSARSRSCHLRRSVSWRRRRSSSDSRFILSEARSGRRVGVRCLASNRSEVFPPQATFSRGRLGCEVLHKFTSQANQKEPTKPSCPGADRVPESRSCAKFSSLKRSKEQETRRHPPIQPNKKIQLPLLGEIAVRRPAHGHAGTHGGAPLKYSLYSRHQVVIPEQAF